MPTLSQSPSTQSATAPLTPAQQKWVDDTFRHLSLREKLGQMLMPESYGVFTQADSADYRDLVRQVEEDHVGGFMVGAKRSPLGVEVSQAYPTAVLINDMQRRAAVPLFFAADFEQGAAMRIAEATSFPSAMAVAAAGRLEDARIVGRITALEARAIGVNWIFAPVADVNVNPDNPIINIRSYGEDPARVGEFVAQFVTGAEENGAMATAKHFPGHGDVSTDSHLVLPVVPGDRQRLETVEWVPFRAAIAAGVASIMTGHLAVPAIDADTTTPATLSPNILQGILRDEMGFRGLIVTDALDMAGLYSSTSGAAYSPTEAAVRAAIAGADVLLMPPDTDAALAALEAAVRDGRLRESRVDESVRRILAAKARLVLGEHPQVDLNALSAELQKPEYLAAAQDIADRGVTLLRNGVNLIPLDPAKPARVLLVAISSDPDPLPGADFEKELRSITDSLTVLRADTHFAPVRALQLPSLDSYDVAIVALFVRVSDRKGTVGLPDDEAALVQQFLSGTKPALVACFGNPYLLERFPAAATWITAFSSVGASQRAVARALYGRIPIQGTIPVSVPGVAHRGDGLRLAARPEALQPAPDWLVKELQPVYGLLDRGVANHSFPGGVLAVGYQNQLALHPFGRLTYSDQSPVVRDDTLYDLASLTKPVVTATAVMLLAEAKRIDLDAPVSHYLPEFASGPDSPRRREVTVRQLLLHTSGLPAHREYYVNSKNKSELLSHIYAEPLTAAPGARVEYSDLGFILLGEIVERVSGQSLDSFAAQNIFKPLGMSHSQFNPPANLRASIAPTEENPAYRHRPLQGEVDDDNAWAMGGVAGHAGLFSTAGDLAIFAQMMLNAGVYGDQRLLARATIQEFTRRQNFAGDARTLGWDVPTQPSSSGRYFSADSYGHTGYTGTSIWIDPQRQLFVILLTNRVHPAATNEKIRDVRPALHDAVIESLGLVTLVAH